MVTVEPDSVAPVGDAAMLFVETKSLAIVGGATTVRVAVLLATPVPPSLDWGAFVALLIVPGSVLVTLTTSVQEPPGGSVPPPKFKVVSPGVAFQVPQATVLTPDGFATCSPDPPVKLSEKLTPVRVTPAFGLLTTSVIVDVPPTGIVVGLKDFVTVGGDATVIEALPVFPVPAFADVTFPVVLFFTPPVVPVMLTATVQVPPADTVPPLNVSVVSPALGTNVPPHDVDAPGVVATCNPDGKASVNPTPSN